MDLDVLSSRKKAMTSLISSAISGSKWTTASQLILLVTALLQTSILARILSPADFGILAIAGVFIGILMIYSELGLSAAIIQKSETTNDILSSLYLLNLGAALVCSLITLALAPVFTQWYEQVELQSVFASLAPAFVLAAIGSQFRALNQKHLRFSLMAKIEVTGAVLSLLIAVTCALNGLGVYSLVFATLTNISTTSLLNLYTGLRYHRPSFAFTPDKIREYLRFGAFQMGESTLNYLNSQIDLLLIGKITGSHALGLYSTSKSLTMRPASLINPIFNRVAFPVMSHSQNDQDGLRRIYLSGMRMLCFINFPIYALLFVAAEPIVRILLGEAWLEAIPILRVLSIYFLIRSTGNPVGSLLMASGRYRRSFYWNLILFGFIPAAIWAGSYFGVLGIAWTMALLQVLLVIPNWYFLVKPCCQASFSEYFSVQTPSLVAATFSALIAWPFANLLAFAWMNLLSITFIGASAYFLLSMLIHPKAINTAKALL